MSLVQHSVLDPRDGAAASQIKAWLCPGQGCQHLGTQKVFTPTTIDSISAGTSGGATRWAAFGSGLMPEFGANGDGSLAIVSNQTAFDAGWNAAATISPPSGIRGFYAVVSNVVPTGIPCIFRHHGLYVQVNASSQVQLRSFTDVSNYYTPASASTDVSGAGKHLISVFFDQASNLGRCRVDNGTEATIATSGNFDATGFEAMVNSNGTTLSTCAFRLHDWVLVSDRGSGLDAQMRVYLAAKHGAAWS